MESTNNIPKFVILSLNVNSLSIFAKLKSITKHVNDFNNFDFVLTDTRTSEASAYLLTLDPNCRVGSFSHSFQNATPDKNNRNPHTRRAGANQNPCLEMKSKE